MLKRTIITISLAAVLTALGLPGALSAETYLYDNTGRLTEVTYDDGSIIIYRYDKAGNILSTCTPAGTEETCGDSVDNNCDGRVDEGCCPSEGDVNLDNSVTAGDALLLFEYYFDLTTISQCQQDQADVNGDGYISASDALCIFEEYLGLSSCLSGP